MHLSRSLPVRPTLGLIIAAVIAGCSSDSVTGPSTRDNAALILHFDSLMRSTSGDRPALYSEIESALAQGAPVGTGTIAVNGTTVRVHVVAQREVGIVDGTPLDSEYEVAAWQGDGSDTAIVFIQSGGSVTSIWGIGTASSEDFGGTASIAPGALGASCTPFTAPADIDVPVPIDCKSQSSVDMFSILLGDGTGPTATLPRQSVAGIRVEIETTPPPG